jgi:hypothetical protein
MYRLVHWLKDTFPFLWEIIEGLNSWFFGIRYGSKLKVGSDYLSTFNGDYQLREANPSDTDTIVRFFKEQPEEAFTFFKPHAFDAKTILKLIKRKSYLFFLVMKDDTMVGYFFLRCFAQGKCFRGKIVDYRWRNKGIAKLMGKASTAVAMKLGLRIFGTISKENVTSMASAAAVNEIRIIKELPNDYVYIEYLPKQNDAS